MLAGVWPLPSYSSASPKRSRKKRFFDSYQAFQLRLGKWPKHSQKQAMAILMGHLERQKWNESNIATTRMQRSPKSWKLTCNAAPVMNLLHITFLLLSLGVAHAPGSHGLRVNEYIVFVDSIAYGFSRSSVPACSSGCGGWGYIVKDTIGLYSGTANTVSQNAEGFEASRYTLCSNKMTWCSSY